MSPNTFRTGRTDAVVEIDERLLRATIRLNTLLLAGMCGGLAGIFLFAAAFLSLYRGLPNPGHYLNLLGVFLPGYSVSPTGAWIGLFWGVVVGAVAGAVVYRIYARTIRQQVNDFLRGRRSVDELKRPTLRVGGHFLGLALGAVTALGLIVTTNWLVIRGTADESVHAALLSNYLSGYSVSFTGSLIGAVELFAVTYLIFLLLGWIYNQVVSWREGNARS